MKLSEIEFSDAQPIDSYGPGFFRIGGNVIHGPMLAHANGAQSWGGFDDLASLLEFAGKIDVLLIGTGAEISHPPREFTRALEEAEIGVEPMQSTSACRTFNILLSEGRRVAAALLPV